MNDRDMRSGEQVYDLICDNIDLDNVFVPESNIVKSEFYDGSNCENAYHRMLDAYSRLCVRLGSEEWDDNDVDDVINELMTIQKHIALKMFEYGMIFGGCISK